MNLNSHPKMNYLYVGIDCHKNIHTATMKNCFNEKLGVITFNNDKKGFESLIKKVDNVKDNLKVIYGLEDTKHLGYNLAQYLLSRNYIVKHINSTYTANERKKNPIIIKNDEYDSDCISKVLIDEFDKLPNEKSDEIYWTLKQVIQMRKTIVKNNTILKNKLHAQLLYHYPNYNKIFTCVDSETALKFFETYPSPNLLKDIDYKTLMTFFKSISKNSYHKRMTERILEFLKEHDIKNITYQEERNNIIRLLVKQINQNNERLKDIEKDIVLIYNDIGKKLTTIPNVSNILGASLLAEIGNINRFQNSSKLARYAGIAPIDRSSGGKDNNIKSQFGNRELNSLVYLVACIGIGTGRTSGENIRAYNPIFREYYDKKILEGKTKHQALICIMRRLINIIYKVLKEDIEYQNPLELEESCKNSFRERKRLEEEKLKKKKELKEKHMREKKLHPQTT